MEEHGTFVLESRGPRREAPTTSDPHMVIRGEYETAAKLAMLGLIRMPDAPSRMPTRREVWAKIGGVTMMQWIRRPPYTMVEVSGVYQGKLYRGFGFSKQNRYGPTADEWNDQEGFNRAYGRAIRDLLDTIMAIIHEQKYGPTYAMEA